MKGSNKYGRGRGLGIKKEVTIAVLVVISLAGVFYYVESNKSTSIAGGQPAGITTISTTGLQCTDSSLPQTAQEIEKEPAFTSLAAGLCYNYIGENTTDMPGYTEYNFAYYNGTITYPCGLYPLMEPQSVIQNAVQDGQNVTSGNVQTLSSDVVFNDYYPQAGCTTFEPVQIVALTDVESTIPAVPQLNLTINAPISPNLVTSLRIVVSLDGGDQAFNYVDVTGATPLPQNLDISGIEKVLSGLSFNANQVFPVAISGAYDTGQTFSYTAQVQIANAP